MDWTELTDAFCRVLSRVVSQNHWKSWYTAADFKQMKEYGLNSIRLPVGYW